MKILVTGANGFIGSRLVTALENVGENVYRHTSKQGDLNDYDSLEQYEDMDCVYHLAAKSFVPGSWETPIEYLHNNIITTVNVLDFCRKKKAKMIFVSTYLYGQPEYLPIDEKHRCVSISPYHLSKKVGEDICAFYSENYGVDIIIARPFNAYGKGQKEEYLLPKLYKQLTECTDGQIEVYDLCPKRDYIYIYDLVEMLVMLKDKVRGLEIYNLGSGQSYSVKEVIDIMQKEIGTHKQINEIGIKRQNEVSDCIADISKFRHNIGDIKLHTLQEGIHEWHKLDMIGQDRG